MQGSEGTFLPAGRACLSPKSHFYSKAGYKPLRSGPFRRGREGDPNQGVGPALAPRFTHTAVTVGTTAPLRQVHRGGSDKQGGRVGVSMQRDELDPTLLAAERERIPRGMRKKGKSWLFRSSWFITVTERAWWGGRGVPTRRGCPAGQSCLLGFRTARARAQRSLRTQVRTRASITVKGSQLASWRQSSK